MEPWMEKVTSPRSPSWLAELGLNTLPSISCLHGFFNWHAHSSMRFCRVQGGGAELGMV